MDRDWEIFERNCLLYLRDKNRDIEFSQTGKSNSRESDIKVYKNSSFLFSIEAKLLPSQCGQFVVNFNKDVFQLSSKNFSINPFSNLIIEKLNNQNLDIKKNFLNLDIDNTLMFDWIKSHYSNKDVKFLIVSKKINKNFHIINLNNIEDYLNVSCVIRRKKSGSRDISKSKRDDAIEELKINLNSSKNHILNVLNDGKSTIVETRNEIKFKYFMDSNLYLSEIRKNTYKIKVLSKTNNLTIVFSIDYKTSPKTYNNDFHREFLI